MPKIIYDERGTILIEFIGSFLLFFLLMMSILSLINIVTAQARVHYALTETANTLSMYGYANSIARAMPQGSKEVLQDINDTLEVLNTFRSGFTSWKNSAPGKNMENLSKFLSKTVQASTMKKEIEKLILYNLSAGGQSGEDYLRSTRISKLELTALTTDSSSASGKTSTIDLPQTPNVIPESPGIIKLTVEYEIDYSFMGLPLPFEPKLRVAQSVMTKMWYQKKGYMFLTTTTTVTLPGVEATPKS